MYLKLTQEEAIFWLEQQLISKPTFVAIAFQARFAKHYKKIHLGRFKEFCLKYVSIDQFYRGIKKLKKLMPHLSFSVTRHFVCHNSEAEKDGTEDSTNVRNEPKIFEKKPQSPLRKVQIETVESADLDCGFCKKESPEIPPDNNPGDLSDLGSNFASDSLSGGNGEGKKEEEKKQQPESDKSSSSMTALSKSLPQPKVPAEENSSALVTRNNENVPQKYIEKMEELKIPPTNDRVVKVVKNSHLSQVIAAINHVDNSWETIKDPIAVFVYQVPRQKVERLGGDKAVTARDFGGYTIEHIKAMYGKKWEQAARHFGLLE